MFIKVWKSLFENVKWFSVEGNFFRSLYLSYFISEYNLRGL